jgi:hypothetical protein
VYVWGQWSRMKNGEKPLPRSTYTGPGGNDVPRDAVRVRVDPSVTSIPIDAFKVREGLVEIGDSSFRWCNQ